MLFLGPTGPEKRGDRSGCRSSFRRRERHSQIDAPSFSIHMRIANYRPPPGYLGHRETAPMLTGESDRMNRDLKLLAGAL